jgi:hypothetical protein
MNINLTTEWNYRDPAGAGGMVGYVTKSSRRLPTQKKAISKGDCAFELAKFNKLVTIVQDKLDV